MTYRAELALVSQGHGHWALYAAKPLYLFPTGSIPLMYVFKLLSQAPDKQGFYGVPFTLKLPAAPESLQVLKRPKLVMFGWSLRPDELSDFLVSQAVPLVYAENVVYVRVELLVAVVTAPYSAD